MVFVEREREKERERGCAFGFKIIMREKKKGTFAPFFSPIIKTQRAFCLLLSRERDDDDSMMLSKAFSRGGGFGGRHVPCCFGRKAAVVFWEWRGDLLETTSSAMRYVATTSLGKDDFDATTTTQRSAVSKNDVDDTQKSSTTSTTSSKRHKSPTTKMIKELNGPKGLEPTRFTDWEVGGRCTDF